MSPANLSLSAFSKSKDYQVQSGSMEQLLILPTGVTHGQEDFSKRIRFILVL
jgi:hypothetical protein